MLKHRLCLIATFKVAQCTADLLFCFGGVLSRRTIVEGNASVKGADWDGAIANDGRFLDRVWCADDLWLTLALRQGNSHSRGH